MIGQTLDNKYKIIRLLGQGAMGAVYEAEHTGTSRRVAVKVIIGDLGQNASLVARFQREAKAAGSIDTQHIAQVLDTGTDPTSGCPFMVMEFLAGEDAQELFLKTAPLRPDLALRMIAQACLGLQKAHEANVIHRDIKPANLFLAERDGGEIVVKILDFGIAKIRQDQSADAGLTRTGSMLGSPLYMSPEQARGQKNIDHRTDVWSLGVVLYQALTGRTPHEDVQALGELIIAICSEEAPPLQDFAPWVSPEVVAIVHRALRFDPQGRYQSAADMLTDVKSCLPDGWSISTDSLTPLTDAERAVVAPSFSPAEQTSLLGAAATDNLAAGRASLIDSGERGRASQPSLGRAPLTSLAQSNGSSSPGTPGSMAPMPSMAPPPKSNSLLIAVVIALAALVLGGGFALLSRPKQPAPVVEVVAPPPTAAPVTTAAAETAAVVTAAPLPDRTVKVVLVPSDVSAEVDGAPATVRDGIIEITGPSGTVHEVSLRKGKLVASGKVTITESGAAPPKLELNANTPRP